MKLKNSDTDIIVTSGAVSAGRYDFIPDLINKFSFKKCFKGVTIKPGRPIMLSKLKNKLFFGLPGNPVAAFVCSVIFARPALYCLSGAGWVEPHTFWVPANFTKQKKPGRQELLRANLTQDNLVNIFKSEGSGRISSLSWANGLVDLPSGLTKVDHGDLVKFIPYSSLGI